MEELIVALLILFFLLLVVGMPIVVIFLFISINKWGRSQEYQLSDLKDMLRKISAGQAEILAKLADKSDKSEDAEPVVKPVEETQVEKKAVEKPVRETVPEPVSTPKLKEVKPVEEAEVKKPEIKPEIKPATKESPLASEKRAILTEMSERKPTPAPDKAPETKTKRSIPTPPSKKPEPSQPEQPSEFEQKVTGILMKIWNWIIVGEEHRIKGVNLEYAVASTWLLRVAIVIILFGIGFFLKYSIDNNYIGPWGRVTVSLLAGLGMLITGLKLSGKKYDLIGQGLLGGGIATLYFSIFASYAMYHLVQVYPAFALMILITLTSAVIAMRFNSLLVIILGIVGGYATPIMLSTGKADFPGLFSYLLLLGIGVLFVARKKDWKLLNFLSFFFTYLLFYAALFKFYKSESDFVVVISFVSAFYVLFSFIPILYNIIHKEKSTLIELTMMILNLALYFPVSYWLIADKFSYRWVAVVSLSLAVFYIAQIYFFIQRKIHDRNLLIILSGFASMAITITVPLVLSSQWITAVWAVQALVFVWMSRKLNSRVVRIFAYIIYFLTFGRMMVFDFHRDFVNPSAVDYWQALMSRFMSMGMLTVSLGGTYYLLKNEPAEEGILEPENDISEVVPTSLLAQVFFWVCFGFLFVYLHFECFYLARTFFKPIQMPLLSAIWIAAIVFAIYQFKKLGSQVYYGLAVLLMFGLTAKLFLFDLHFWGFTKMGYSSFSFLQAGMRFLDFVPIVGVLAVCAIIFSDTFGRKAATLFGTFALGLLFIYLTFEVNTYLRFNIPNFRAGGVSILWGVFALSCIFSGLLKHIRALRYTGLALFAVTALKIFFSDLSQLSQIYKIIAFIALGLVILVGAIIYIKFEDIFQLKSDNETKEMTDES